MIEFSHDFTKESASYVLFEMPAELKGLVQNGQSLVIQEYKTDSYILGGEHLYQIIKSQISNLMLISDAVPDKTNHFRVKSFQQSVLIPTCVKPFSRDILIHLRGNTIGESDDLDIEELNVEYLKKKFVTNDINLDKIVKSVGAVLKKSYVVNLAPNLREKIFTWAMDQIREKGLSTSKDSVFKIKDLMPFTGLQFDRMTFPDQKVEIALKSMFKYNESEDTYQTHLPGIIDSLLIKIKQETREIFYEELVDRLRELTSITLPRSLLDSYGPDSLSLEIESVIKKNFLVADNTDYTVSIQSYTHRQALAILSDLDLLAENALER